MMSTHPFNVGLTKIKYEVSTAKSSQSVSLKDSLFSFFVGSCIVEGYKIT